MVTGAIYENDGYRYGVFTRTGDTLLPIAYDAVSHGREVFAGRRSYFLGTSFTIRPGC